jgi:hypothetical protein
MQKKNSSRHLSVEKSSVARASISIGPRSWNQTQSCTTVPQCWSCFLDQQDQARSFLRLSPRAVPDEWREFKDDQIHYQQVSGDNNLVYVIFERLEEL